MSPVTLADRMADARTRLVAAGISADEAAVDVDLFALEELIGLGHEGQRRNGYLELTGERRERGRIHSTAQGE